jgi:hypothetical protein
VELAVRPPSRTALLVRHRDREQTQAAGIVIETIRAICAELA